MVGDDRRCENGIIRECKSVLARKHFNGSDDEGRHLNGVGDEVEIAKLF